MVSKNEAERQLRPTNYEIGFLLSVFISVYPWLKIKAE
jgi:hypothetical protein